MGRNGGSELGIENCMIDQSISGDQSSFPCRRHWGLIPRWSSYVCLAAVRYSHLLFIHITIIQHNTVYCTAAPQVPTVCRARSPCYLALDGIWSLGSIIAIIILVFSCCSLVRTQQIISIIILILVQHTTTKAMAYSNNYLPHHLGRHLPSNSFIISQLNPADQSIWSIPSLLVVLLFFSDPI